MSLNISKEHLTAYFPKPCEGEEIPIHFIDFEEKIAGWSPELKRTLYMNDIADTEELKRVRDVTLLKVYNWFSDSESIIELSYPERIQFENVMDKLVKHSGEIRYTTRKINGKMVNVFRLERGAPARGDVKEKLLADLL
ncbi:MAG TPA: hypothetical protein C5S51_13090 [Methanosarcinaceae archaeon]|nr:hypothetical protein [Methanosarcinaceae archaeon]